MEGKGASEKLARWTSILGLLVGSVIAVGGVIAFGLAEKLPYAPDQSSQWIAEHQKLLSAIVLTLGGLLFWAMIRTWDGSQRAYRHAMFALGTLTLLTFLARTNASVFGWMLLPEWAIAQWAEQPPLGEYLSYGVMAISGLSMTLFWLAHAQHTHWLRRTRKRRERRQRSAQVRSKQARMHHGIPLAELHDDGEAPAIRASWEPMVQDATENLSASEILSVESTEISHSVSEAPEVPARTSKAQSRPALASGTILDKYEIIEALAAGGMGVVYRAKHTLLGREVALKVLLPNLALSPQIQARFQREAWVQAQLSHSNIVRVSDLIMDQGQLALVMDLVGGPSLERVLRTDRSGPWSIEDTLTLLKPMLSGLAYAHTRGVIHRDLKPGNILLERRDGVPSIASPRVTDFGLAKIVDSDHVLTQTGARMGTVPYMAPEQFEGSKTVDATTDVFAVGMLMWRLFTGKLPIDRNNMRQVLAFYTGQLPPLELRSVAPHIPEGVSRVVEHALALAREDRPPDADALLQELLGA